MQRYNEAFCLIMIDIDLFKEVNDEHGHICGDKVLVEFATLLKNSIRETDTLGRWGGEEFMIICPNSTIEGTHVLCESIREKIENFTYAHLKPLTASFGLTFFKNKDTLESIVNRCDRALYEAKAQGRNKVIAFDS